MKLREALNTIGVSEVTVRFIEDFQNKRSDRHEALAWTLKSRNPNDMIRKLKRTTFIAGAESPLDLTVDSMSPTSAHRIYYGDHESCTKAGIEIFVKMPVQYYEDD